MTFTFKNRIFKKLLMDNWTETSDRLFNKYPIDQEFSLSFTRISTFRQAVDPLPDDYNDRNCFKEEFIYQVTLKIGSTSVTQEYKLDATNADTPRKEAGAAYGDLYAKYRVKSVMPTKSYAAYFFEIRRFAKAPYGRKKRTHPVVNIRARFLICQVHRLISLFDPGCKFKIDLDRQGAPRQH